MNSVMHDFSQVPSMSNPRSTFDRSHGRHATFNAGDIIPILVDEGLPGDTINCKLSHLVRQQTPIAPIMDNLFVDTFYFAVPMRILWSNWKKFQGEQANPGDSTSYTIPQVVSPAGGFAAKSLYDYLGMPTTLSGANTISVSALFGRAYNLIWNEWFRDQNIQNSLTVPLTDGPDTYSDFVIKKRGKRHDYFTSCLPFAQKGTAVALPLGTSAPVLGIAIANSSAQASANLGTQRISTGTTQANFQGWRDREAYGSAGQTAISIEEGTVSGYPNVRADLSNATAATINQLRQAFAVQQILELDARGGTRYVEAIKARFGVISPDFRLQRPEYLGGSSHPMNIMQVAQTSATSGQPTPQGNLSAFASSHGTSNGFTYSPTEHVLILGFVSVRADLRYQQGLDRMFSRSTRYDFYEPSLANIGEQSVLNKEIYADGSANDSAVFGYQARFDEYRYKNSMVTGEFRSSYSTPLDMWHLAQKFTALPVLQSASFIQEDPPMSRVSAVTTQDYFKGDFYFKYTHSRPMPVYGVPGLSRL